MVTQKHLYDSHQVKTEREALSLAVETKIAVEKRKQHGMDMTILKSIADLNLSWGPTTGGVETLSGLDRFVFSKWRSQSDERRFQDELNILTDEFDNEDLAVVVAELHLEIYLVERMSPKAPRIDKGCKKASSDGKSIAEFGFLKTSDNDIADEVAKSTSDGADVDVGIFISDSANAQR